MQALVYYKNAFEVFSIQNSEPNSCGFGEGLALLKGQRYGRSRPYFPEAPWLVTTRTNPVSQSVTSMCEIFWTRTPTGVPTGSASSGICITLSTRHSTDASQTLLLQAEECFVSVCCVSPRKAASAISCPSTTGELRTSRLHRCTLLQLEWMPCGAFSSRLPQLSALN